MKIVRETMNRAIDLWKEVPGVSDEVSDETESKSSSSRGKQPKNSLFLDFFSVLGFFLYSRLS